MYLLSFYYGRAVIYNKTKKKQINANFKYKNLTNMIDSQESERRDFFAWKFGTREFSEMSHF